MYKRIREDSDALILFANRCFIAAINDMRIKDAQKIAFDVLKDHEKVSRVLDIFLMR